ncbi:MAG: hypothetical protein HY020_04360 [Burkholderiales bacterium]|nr:hypothetical protein [Burkholderiales bacterium]
MHPLKWFVAFALAASSLSAVAEPKAAWRSSEWGNPRFPFPYESGEIREEAKGLLRFDERFERPVAPGGAVSPQAANFWRFCVISHFASKQGFAGWAFAEGLDAKFEPTATTMYFVMGNVEADVAEKFRPDFHRNADFERLCSQFLKPEYHWWK